MGQMGKLGSANGNVGFVKGAISNKGLTNKGLTIKGWNSTAETALRVLGKFDCRPFFATLEPTLNILAGSWILATLPG